MGSARPIIPPLPLPISTRSFSRKRLPALTGRRDANGGSNLLAQDVRGGVHLAHVSKDAGPEAQAVERRPVVKKNPQQKG